MTNQVEQTPTNTSNTKSHWITTGVFCVALAAAFGGWWHETNQVSSVRQELNRTQQQIADIHSQFDQSLAVSKTQTEQSVAQMNAEVERVRKEAASSTSRAQATAKQQAGKVMVTLNEKNKILAEQLEQIKKDSTEASSKVDQTINGIKGDVGDVKVEVASAKTEIDRTNTELRRMTGDLGIMSGLIATNSTELSALRKLGERDYVEFTLPKTGAAQRVGDIQLALRKTDLKRNRFTIYVLADDKRVEKKDKTINEPVQFYTSSTRIPYEVVINQVAKDKVVGYLSIPKVKMMASR